MRAALLALALLSWAPMQCGSQPDQPAFEDSPGQALWALSERFREAGDEAGRRRTLQFLVERYPSSRFAVRARVVLGEEEGTPP